MSDSLQALGWDELVGRLGSTEELEISAREAGALLRKRQVASAADLLRLCFAYVLGRFLLRTLAALAEQRALASLSGSLRRLERRPTDGGGGRHGGCAAWAQAGLLDGAHGVRPFEAEALFGGSNRSP